MINARIGVATVYGRPYYRFATYLKALNLPFDSILPEDIMDYSGSLVLTTREESPKECPKPLLHEDIFEHPPTVIKGRMMQKLSSNFEEDLVLGVDPGQRIGLSVCYLGKEIEGSFYSSVEDLVLHAVRVLRGLRARRKIVKIGDGNMQIAKEIASMLSLRSRSPFELEFVDEKRTSPKIKNFNQGGKRDMLSARFISQRDGYSVQLG